LFYPPDLTPRISTLHTYILILLYLPLYVYRGCARGSGVVPERVHLDVAHHLGAGADLERAEHHGLAVDLGVGLDLGEVQFRLGGTMPNAEVPIIAF
jgi:hypothetical protein